MTDKLSVIDLFAGIGGFSLGLHRTGGFVTVKFCELKLHAQAVLAKNFPGVPCHGDVTTLQFKKGEADVVTAGFPCQDLSFAGIGAGLAGARSGLYREVVRALRLVRPAYAVLENVAALLSRGLGTVLGDLAEIGYDTEWHCIPASAVGAPHRRDRVWIIAEDRWKQREDCRSPFSGSIAAQLSAAYVADAQSERRDWSWSGTELAGWSEPANGGQAMADTKRIRQSGPGEPVIPSNQTAAGKGQASDAVHGRIGDQWSVEPGLGRVAHGVPNRVDRLEELGNAVVPQIPEIIGNAILERMRALP